jgi:hypothetical protein
MLRGIITNSEFVDQLSKAIGANRHYLIIRDLKLGPFEVTLEGSEVRMGLLAWDSWSRSNKTETAKAAQQN